MEEREHRNPGSQIRALTTDTSLGEIYAAGQFLAEMTKGRRGLDVMTVENRQLYWRNEVVAALFDRGLVRDVRVGADGHELGSICGVIIVKRENDKAVIVINETSFDAIEMGKALLQDAKDWAAKEGLRLGIWQKVEPVFIEIR